MKIFIVDDEKDILEFLSYNLEKEGYQVSTALNGVLALGLAKKIKPDLIILDVMMPVKDGFSTAKDIRGIDKNVPIIFLTAKSMNEDTLKGFEKQRKENNGRSKQV